MSVPSSPFRPARAVLARSKESTAPGAHATPHPSPPPNHPPTHPPPHTHNRLIPAASAGCADLVVGGRHAAAVVRDLYERGAIVLEPDLQGWDCERDEGQREREVSERCEGTGRVVWVDWGCLR